MSAVAFEKVLTHQEIQQMIFNEHREFFKLVGSTREVNHVQNQHYCLITTPRTNKAVGKTQPHAANFKEALLNTVFYIKANLLNANELIDETLQHFRKKNLPSLWFIGPDSSPNNVEELLLQRGFYQTKLADGVFAELPPKPKEIILPQGIKLVTIKQKEQFEDWIQPIQIANNINEVATASYRAMFEELFDKTNKLKHYIAYYEGRPIASSTLYLGPQSVGLYNRSSLQVSAKLAHKLALNVMIQNEFNEAIKHGYRYVTSQCTPITTRAVRHLGFKAYHTYKVFYGI